MFKRVILLVCDSVGVGAADDAARFGDTGANTLGHIKDWCSENNLEFSLPHLNSMGLERIFDPKAPANATAAWGVLKESSPGKDTTTGHWEIAGTVLEKEFPTYPKGFPEELLQKWCDENQLLGWLGNTAASGTTIIEELGEEHIRSGNPILYTSADSVLQIACHEKYFGLERLYTVCESARKIVDCLGIGRVIARPFVGETRESFERTENRRDYSVPPPQPNLLDVLRKNNLFVAGVGKIEDIFAHRSVNLVNHTGNNSTSMDATVRFLRDTDEQSGLIFTNLIDFDMHFGHRRDPEGYARALMTFDARLPEIFAACNEDDLVIITADHGNDPTHSGSDHTRENVPLLLWSKHPNFKGGDLGTQKSFACIARICLEALDLKKEIPNLKSTQSAASLLEKVL